MKCLIILGEIMFEIKKVDEFNIDEVKSFLLTVPTIIEIDDEVLKNGFVLYSNKIIKLVISCYIKYNYALIRYFVYKKDIDEIFIKETLNLLERELFLNCIDYLVAIVDSKEIFKLYSKLDFKVDKKGIFTRNNTINKKTKIMVKHIYLEKTKFN